MGSAETVDATAVVIRDVALAHFARTGYEGATMRGIAAEVGVKASSLYHHFPSKQDLLWDLAVCALDALEDGWERARAALPASRTVHDELVAFVASHVRFHATHSTEATLVNGHLQGLAPQRYLSVVRRRDRYAGELVTLLTTGRDDGAFEIPDMQLTAYAILQMGIGVATWYLPNGPRSVDQLCAGYVAVALKIVRPEGVARRPTRLRGPKAQEKETG